MSFLDSCESLAIREGELWIEGPGGVTPTDRQREINEYEDEIKALIFATSADKRGAFAASIDDIVVDPPESLLRRIRIH